MNDNQFLEMAITAACRAGAEILKVYETDFDVELKSDKSPLTIADQKGHEVIVAYLADTGVPILSEEGADIPYAERGSWDQFWLVDPLDGTKEFVNRNGEFTVNVALIREGSPMLGVVFVPVTGELYFASEETKSIKVDLSNEKINTEWVVTLDEMIAKGKQLLRIKKLEPYTVVASKSHLSPETKEFIDLKSEEVGEIKVLSRGSSLKFCMVAEGLASVYPRYAPTMEWDTGAGHAIVRYAGYKVTEYQKETELRYNKEELLNPWFLVH